MPSFQPPPPSQPQRNQSVDVRALSLAQLHYFAKRGSRRAKAELERRMGAADGAAAAPQPAPAPSAAPARPPRRTPPTVPGELAPTRPPRHALPTVPGELAPRSRPAPTVPGELAPRSRPAPTVPGELGASRPTRRTAPRPAPAPADDAFPSLPEPDTQPQKLRPSVDVDIGNDKTPAHHFSAAPFPSTEMLGVLLPMADTSDKPLTPSYTIDVRPEDIPQPGEGAADGAPPQFMAVSKTEYLPFPSTEVIDRDHPTPAAPPAAHGQRPPPHAREPREAHAPATRPPRTHETRLPSQFRESQATDSLVPDSHMPDSRQPFDESHTPEERHHHHRRRKSRRAEGAPDSQQERMADQLAAITRQESAQSRADDVPRLIGLVLIIWGIIVAFGGVFMLANGHGIYFLASGLAVIGVGWLLYKLKRLALPVHIGALLLFLLWAWSGKSVSALEAFTQCAPLLIPALWMLVPSIREPLH